MLREVESHWVAAGRGYSRQENAAMLRAVFRLFEHWGVSDAQAATLLGGVATKTVQRWRGGASANLLIDQSDRLSSLLGIHKALRLLFADEARCYGWPSRASEDFGGKSALEIMLGGHLQDITRIRRYLDSVRGGW